MNDKTKTRSIREAFRELVGPIMKANPKGRPIDKDGKVYLDPTPVEPPLGFKPHKPMYEQIREMVRSEALRQAAENQGLETFEDADDFRIGDDFDPTSPYEYDFDPPPPAPEKAKEEEKPTPPPAPPEGDKKPA